MEGKSSSKKMYFSCREKCPACYSKTFNVLYRNSYDEPPISEYLKAYYISLTNENFFYLKGAHYILCECKECNLIFQKETPNEDLIKIIYDKWLGGIRKKTQYMNSELSSYTKNVQEISTIIAFLQKLPSEISMFDFGMGWGKWALMAKAFGCKSYGTELSEERKNFAKENGIKVIEWNEIPKHRFDFINTEQVFEHLPNPFETLIYLKYALKADGIIKISVPTANNITRRLKIMDWKAPRGTKSSLNPVAPLEHINFFRRKTIIKMARLAGMKEVVIPMRIQYYFKSNWHGTKRIAKNIISPIYLNLFKKRNYLFFKVKGAHFEKVGNLARHE